MVLEGTGLPGSLRVRAWLTSDGRHLPYVIEGLQRLEQAGALRLDLRVRPSRWRDRVRIEPAVAGVTRISRPYPWSLDLDIATDSRSVRAAVDLQDWSELFSHRSLGRSDIVFKRMFAPDIADLVEEEYGVPVVPAGISHGVDGSALARTMRARVARLAGGLEAVVNRPALLRSVPDRLRARRSTTDASRGVGPTPPGDAASPADADRGIPDGDFAFFQVVEHAWGGPDGPADRLNRDRIELIRTLRRKLGERFVGGMAFRGSASADLADAATDRSTDRDTYLDLVRHAAVVVAGLGFADSPPWKLAEYLEAGCAIVAEELPVALPAPLGEAVVTYRTHDECATRCAELLDDPERRAAMGRTAAGYYREHVAPDAAAARFLRTALAAP